MSAIATVLTRAIDGVDAVKVSVEAHIVNGLPGVVLVGLPEAAVKESRERVRSALISSGFSFPQRKIILNLAPADLPKQGGRYDLAIAIAVLIASNQIDGDRCAQFEFLGELALDGSLRPASGTLAAAIEAHSHNRALICSEQANDPACLSDGITWHAKSLRSVTDFIETKGQLVRLQHQTTHSHNDQLDLNEVIGQSHGKRALTLAAAGRHHLLMSGTPGSGKSMLAHRLSGILPDCSMTQALEIQRIYSITQRQHPFSTRPFRAPHHSASTAALVGGGNPPQPGEITLAHEGVLFLDELAEFSRATLDNLREPLEAHKIQISRAGRSVVFPANFQLVAATNPCPCGYAGTPQCRCTNAETQRYQARLSGPLMDRFDLHVELRNLDLNELKSTATTDRSLGESAAVRQRVIDAQQKQLQRQGKLNGELSKRELNHFCPLTSSQHQWLATLCEKKQWSLRAWDRIHRVAQTISDLNNETRISDDALKEATLFRRSGLSTRG
jgi:magnesium chelatase family protein